MYLKKQKPCNSLGLITNSEMKISGSCWHSSTIFDNFQSQELRRQQTWLISSNIRIYRNDMLPPCGSGRASPELACPRRLQLRARSPWGCQATSGLSKPKDSSHKQGNAGSESDRPSPQHTPGSGRAKEGTQAFKNARTGTSLVVQWLRLRTPNAGVGARFNPWPGN